jgi:hypothetical protein
MSQWPPQQKVDMLSRLTSDLKRPCLVSSDEGNRQALVVNVSTFANDIDSLAKEVAGSHQTGHSLSTPKGTYEATPGAKAITAQGSYQSQE